VRKTPQIVLYSFAAFVFAWFVTTLGLTVNAAQAVKLQDWERAKRSAQISRVLLTPVRFSIGFVSSDVQAWFDSLLMIESASRVAQLTQTYLPSTLASDQTAQALAPQLQDELKTLFSHTRQWLQSTQQSTIFSRFISSKLPQAAQQLTADPSSLLPLIDAADVFSTQLLTGKHKYVFLLQNTDEIRATGGFMGSYAVLELDQGMVQRLEIQDIYVPDGQYQGFTPAPPGLDEFLSGGKGLRLPDSNWNPDFPSASQEILQFFALGKETDIEGVIAINLQVVEDVLRVIGPLYLSDYDQTVTAENLSQLARMDRAEFFPGSQQKRRFLQALFTQLKINTQALNTKQAVSVFEILQKAILQKNLQLYSKDPLIQDLSTRFHLDGKVLTQGKDRYFFLVESNVGINKVNRLVSRQVTLDQDQVTTRVNITFENKNPETTLKAERGEYINYQRLLVPLSYKVKAITVGDNQINDWDEQLFTTSSGEQLKQLGFLVPIPAQAQQVVAIEITHPSFSFTETRIQKQSGLSPTPYLIKTPFTQHSILLEQDQVISLNTASTP
jgi:hypothetical protein